MHQFEKEKKDFLFGIGDFNNSNKSFKCEFCRKVTRNERYWSICILHEKSGSKVYTFFSNSNVNPVVTVFLKMNENNHSIVKPVT